MKKVLYLRRRNGRVVECGGLENRCPAIAGPGVRIPLSPPINIITAVDKIFTVVCTNYIPEYIQFWD